MRLIRIIGNIPAEKYNVLMVDYGTPDAFRHELDGLECEQVKVIRHEATDDIFSIGHARDIGVQHATDAIVMFHDVDFFASTAMYERIHAEVGSRKMVTNAYDFFCVPVFFLSESGSDLALRLVEESPAADHELHRHLYQSTAGVVEFPAYGSSAIVVNKNHYSGIGGHSREFYGHGAEDYDILHRLSSYYPKGPRTADYYLDLKSNQISSYKGFRAYFALYGLDIFAKGIYFVHLWHPKRTIPGYQQSNRNFTLLADLMRRFDKSREQPHPLGNLSDKRRGLILMKPESSSFRAIRHALPSLGDFDVIPEEDFKDVRSLILFCERNGVDNILFLNPYANEHRLCLYLGVRASGLKYYVFDRGALPNSWFFDPNGFNFDSSSYKSENWDSPLSVEQEKIVENYIVDLRNSEDALEENGKRKSARHYHDHYAIGRRKVLFVPFQRPSDTVTNYFAGASKSVFGFQDWVAFIAANLSRSEWVVICKNHPLDQDLPKIEGVLYAEMDTHIHDLLELSDKVLLMNSGVGVLAMGFAKPVICASQAFYAHDGIAYSAFSKENALKLIQDDLVVDQDKIKRFYSYLLKSVYSFGKTQYRRTIAQDGSQRNMVESILFETIRFPGTCSIDMGVPPKGISLDAPLFLSFGGRVGIKAGIEKKPIVASKTSSIAKISPLPSSHKMDIEKKIQDRTIKAATLKRKIFKLIFDPKLFFSDFLRNRV